MSQNSENSVVRIAAPSRLHMGFLDLDGSLGRTFGGIGLALDEPATRLSLRRSNKFSVTGLQEEASRIEKILERIRTQFSVPHNFAVDVEDLIPAHSGLGSGTQLAIALSAGVAKLENLSASATNIAACLGRGARSAIGLAAFDDGGLIVDGGRAKTTRTAPPILARHSFPENWRVLLVFDRHTQGAHGANEQAAFEKLKPLPEIEFSRICHLVLMQLLPSLIEKDIALFGAAVSEIQKIVGRQFAPAQSGSAWTSPAVGKLMNAIQKAGGVGIGQSSWGPTGFAFAPSTAEADRLYHSFQTTAKQNGLELHIVRGRNQGAAVEIAETAALGP